MNTPKFSKKIMEKLEKLTSGQLVFVALLMSTFVAVTIYLYLSGLEGTAQNKKVQNLTTVVTAAVDIPERTVLREEMLKVVQVPPELVPPDAVTDVASAVKKVSLMKIIQGDVLSEKKLYAEGKMAGFIGSIPADRRAISIPITDATGISGLAQPGDYVDVMVISSKTYKNAVSGEMVLQNVPLLSINKSTEIDDKKGKLVTATIAVSPEDAVRLAVAQTQGVIYLAMRPFKPQENFVLVPEILVTAGGLPASSEASPPAPRAVSAPLPAPQQSMPHYQTAPFSPAPVSIGSSGYNIAVIRGTSISTVNVK